MDEQTISGELDFSTSDSTTEQAENTNNPSVQETIEQPDNQDTNSDTDTTPTDGQVDDQSDVQVDDTAIQEFLTNKGINLDEPGNVKDIAYKLAKMALNSEKQFNSKSQEIAQLKRQLANVEAQPQINNQPAAQNMPLQADIELERQRTAQLQADLANFKKEKRLTPEEEGRMAQWLNERSVTDPATGQSISLPVLWLRNGLMTLEDIYNVSGCPALRSEAVKSKMRSEVEKSMAARQAAKRPAGSATNSSQFGEQSSQDELFLEGLLGE